MELRLDLDKEYGIVLEGGGAKGAYQVGAWKALREAGVKIKGVSGVSVGALNGALICMDDMETAENIWENISYSKVMDVDEEMMEDVMSGNLKTSNLGKILKEGMKILVDGGMDIAPLRQLIEHAVDEDKIRRSPMDFYVITYSVSDHKLMEVNVKEAPEGLVPDMLLASAYFLAFKNEKLHGKRYMDGGAWNNVPFDTLMKLGYKDIIILRIYGLGFDKERTVEIPEDVTVYHVAPRRDLGGILEFDKKKSRRNMKLGYYDAQRMMYGLEGKHYYIDAPEQESHYFDRLIGLAERAMEHLGQCYMTEGKEQLCGYRIFTEGIFPTLAGELKLKKDWNYKELYLGMLEEAAAFFRINRYKVYSVEELTELIGAKLELYRQAEKDIPVYMEIFEKLS